MIHTAPPPKHTVNKRNISHGLKHTRCTLILGLIALLLLVATPALAQDRCETLNEDPEWTEGLNQLIATMRNNEMKAAKGQAKALAEICADSPALNYLQGKIEESLGDSSKALYYYQKSSENTYKFAVEPDTAKMIWYARYEYEHPDRTDSALAATQAQIDTLKDQTKDLEEQIKALGVQNNALEDQNNTLEDQNKAIQNDKLELYSSLMWTGTGIGIGGLILIIIGGALVATTPLEIQQDAKISTYIASNGKVLPYYDANYNFSPDAIRASSFGWASIGIGAGMMATGAVLAGIFGYKYTHSNLSKEEITFQLSPMNFSIGMQF